MAGENPEFDESALDREFQDGLSALRDEVGSREIPVDHDVRPIATVGTDVVVRLGRFPTDSFPPDYDDDEYIVFVKIPERFPTGDGKGFATIPPLSRSDRNLANNPWSSFHETIADRLNVNEDRVQSYSHNWEHTNMNQAADMVKFLDVAEEFLARG